MSVPYLPLEAWKKHWGLEGLQVRCLGCGASQHLQDLEAFRHALGCHAWERAAQYPGRELSALLEQKRRTLHAHPKWNRHS